LIETLTTPADRTRELVELSDLVADRDPEAS